jgi:CheY-like chemotaxis protein
MTGILVVDDEAAVRALLAAALRQLGFPVWLAANGHEAIELYRKHGPEIGVVLLDVRMPGLDGPQTLMVLQQLSAQVRCCFMTGDTGCYTEEELLRLGAVGVLSKPFSLAGILRVLEQLLR